MLGKRLNAVRKERGFTAQQMADMLGMSIRNYRKYESEESRPTYETLIKMADILDVTTDYLLCRDRHKK